MAGFAVLNRPAPIAVVLLLCSLVLISRCADAPLSLDDSAHLKLAMQKRWTQWFEPTPESTYFPVTMFSYVVDLHLFGAQEAAEPIASSNPHAMVLSAEPEFAYPKRAGMRLMNALYHALAGFFLWLFLKRIGVGTLGAALVAIAWTGHPLACESVCWISERKNVLAACFGFATLLTWTAGRQHRWRWPLLWVLYALALLSKPAALGLFPVLIALDILDPRWNEFRWREPRHWLLLGERLSMPALLCVVTVWLGVHAHQREIIPPPGGSVFTALLTDTEIVARYVKNIFFPAQLSFFYSVQPVTSLADWRPWAFGLVLLAFTASCLWLAHRAGERNLSLAALGVVWFFGALAPNANIVAIPFWMQDRYVYLASAGALTAVAAALPYVLGALERHTPLLPRLIWAWPALLITLSVARSGLFSSNDKLYMDAVAQQPGSAFARLTAINMYKRQYHRHSANGDQPNPELARQTAVTLLNLLDGIEKCPDVHFHRDVFSLRVERARVLMLLGQLSDARQALGVVPPPGLELISPELLSQSRAMYLRGYTPETLAQAWSLLGDISLRESAAPARPPEERLRAADAALSAAERAYQAHPLDDAPLILKARAQFRLADLHAAQKQSERAMQLYDAGVTTLKTVPPTSLSYKAAQQGLAVMTPPKTTD